MTSHKEKVLISVFRQRDLLYDLYLVNNKLLANRTQQINSLKTDYDRLENKFSLKEKENLNNLNIAEDYKKLYKKEKREKRGIIVGGCVVIGASAAFIIYNEFKR